MNSNSFYYDREKEIWFRKEGEKEQPFCPLIFTGAFDTELCKASPYNTYTISLDVSQHAQLDFKKAFKEASQIKEAGKRILWNLNFGFHNHPLKPGDESQFNALKFSLLEFKKQLWELFKDDTFGICLFEGEPSLNLVEYSLKQHSEYLTWLEKRQKHSPSLDKIYQELKTFDEPPKLESLIDLQSLSKWSCLYMADLLLDFFHYLLPYLDGEIPVFVFLKSSEENPVVSSVLFSQERFEYIEPLSSFSPSSSLGINRSCSKGYWGSSQEAAKASLLAFQSKKEARLGLLLPEAELIDDEALEDLNKLLKTLSKEKIECRLISERFFTELWQELDQVMVHPKLLSRSGKRKLHGFCAAQGEIILLEPSNETYASSRSIEQWQEISFERLSS